MGSVPANDLPQLRETSEALTINDHRSDPTWLKKGPPPEMPGQTVLGSSGPVIRDTQ